MYYGAPPIVTNGLVLALDAGNTKSYPGSGDTIYNLVDKSPQSLFGTYSITTTQNVIGIRLNNPTTVASYIQLSTLTNITTVSLWYYVHSTPYVRYLLDARTGGTNGWIYSGGPGNDWGSGMTYFNGILQGTTTWAKIEPYINAWVNVTVIANTPITDDMNLFSRYSDTEGYDVTFGLAQVYNRTLTAQEVLQNYNATKTRFGLS